MCLCLDARQKRHLSTIFWRLRTVIKRSTKAKIFAILFPLIVIGTTVGIGLESFNATEASINSLNDYIVTSSTYDGASNVFDTDLVTTQDF